MTTIERLIPSPISFEALISTMELGGLVPIPTNVAGDWTQDNVGSGSIPALDLRGILADTGVVANSRGHAYAYLPLVRVGLVDQHNWDKKQAFLFSVRRTGSDIEVTCYAQLKDVVAAGDLTAKGLGLVIKNLALYGESYGTARGEVDLGFTLQQYINAWIAIVHDPGNSVKFYVNGVLRGTQSTLANIPSGLGANYMTVHAEARNGATGGVSASIWLCSPAIMEKA